jgi:hypothetical protein
MKKKAGNLLYYTLIILINLVIWKPIVTKLVPFLILEGSVGVTLEPSEAIWDGELYEFCELENEQSYDDASYVSAGTPMPTQSVSINTPVAEITPVTLETDMEEAMPVVATETPMQNIEYKIPELTVRRPNNYSERNYHVVVVFSGYSDTDVPFSFYEKLKLSSSFAGVNVDFAYVNEYVDLNFHRVARFVEADSELIDEIIKRIKKTYPLNGLVIVVNTSDHVGTAMFSLRMGYAIQPADIHVITHEVGHLLGMRDGYKDYYPDDEIPNNELFYIDEIPKALSKALEKLGYVPPLYLRGTCHGRKVYSFYESWNNVYGDYSPDGHPSWGESTFTPLQIILMNDYIKIFTR